jgi:hypothetical protein
MRHSRFVRFAPLVLVLGIACALPACNRSARSDLDTLTGGPQFTLKRDEQGLVVQLFDATGNGIVDVARYFEEYPDPNNPAVTRRRMRKMEIDVNGDQNVNIRRFYDDHGNIWREELDKSLDGRMDTVSYFEGGQLIRKELIDPDTGRITATRFYRRGVIERVEIDTSGNDQTDYWEYYEEGVLTRVGRDLDGDGRVDSWRQR